MLDLTFGEAQKALLHFVEKRESLPRFASLLSIFATSSNSLLVNSGLRFIFIVKDIVEQLTPLVILHFGANLLTRISQFFDKYVDTLIKALPGMIEEDNLTKSKEVLIKAETDREQLAILGTAFTVVEEQIPMAVSRIWSTLNESKEVSPGPFESMMRINTVELKNWRRELHHSFDKLGDHFCRQYVLRFIYSRDGETLLLAQTYLNSKADLSGGSDPLPTLPFQALFAKLQQLATVASDVLLGKEKLQKVLLARLMETAVIWLSEEKELWDL